MSNEVSTSSQAPPAVDPIRAALNDLVTWSQNAPVWQRDALRRLYSQTKLSPGDLYELFILCRQAHNLLEASETALTWRPLDASDVPVSLNTGGPVVLKSLGCTRNVNALADDQTLQFGETGLTIVYGDNGSGKSGYGRVLKRACRARDQEDILPNAYSTPRGKASARIKYCVGDVVQPEVAWQDGVAANPMLSSISVFDSKCASVHVDGKNELAYTPVPLQLLQALAETCRDFTNRLKTKKTALEAQVPAFKKKPSSREGTAVHQILLNLCATTNLSAINSLAEVSEHEKTRLEQLKHDLAADPVKELRMLKTQKQRIEELLVTVAKSDGVLRPATAEGLRDLLQSAEDRATAAQLVASESFNKEPLPQAGSEVWKTLWEAARAFSTQEAYPAQAFPNTDTGAVCILCQQALSPEAATRMSVFEKFVQEKVQQGAAEAKLTVQRRKDEIIKSCVSVESLRETVRLLRDELDQPQVCRDVIRNLVGARVRGRRLNAATNSRVIGNRGVTIPVAAALGPLMVGLDERIAEIQKTSDPEERKVQENELRGLEDRVWLTSILADVEAEVGRLKTIAAFGKAIDDTDTNRITRKTTEVSRALVTDTIRDAFAADVAALYIADRRIELTQETSGYGSTRFRVSLIRNPKARVASVLSEGEHRCVALAAFLAELSTAHNRSGVIFDDPVSSLDHNYRETVAGRLVKEATTGRQVIVFTHDIPFLMMLDDEARKQGQTPLYQSVNRAGERAGMCNPGAPFKAKTVPEIVDKLDERLATTSVLHISGRLEEWSDQVKAMAGFLRDGWERAAETCVAPVVRRYNNRVHPGGLRQLTVLTDQDFSDLNEGYNFASTYCHTDSAALNRPIPSPAKIKDEIDRLRNWFDSVRTRQEQKR